MKDSSKIVLKRLNNGGFSLVEVIVSMTLLVVVATVLLTGVMTAGAINAKSVDLTNAGYDQAASLEEESRSVNDSGTQGVSISIGSQNPQVMGHYISKEDTETGVSFTMFVPNLTAGGGTQPPGGSENTPTFSAIIGGNPNYAITAWNGINNYIQVYKDGGNKANIKEGSIHYELVDYVLPSGQTLEAGYYFIRDDQYMGPTMLPQEVYNFFYHANGQPNYGVKINMADNPDELDEPDASTRAGDLMKIGNEVYVFFPYPSDPNGIGNTSWWHPIHYYSIEP